ncbi:SRPBCC family protein [Paludibaculum fermentans]|uniref:SRPBCC family protein n=1 Tax=Paludibaculum fermentans TaxID=1473598 RepID=A0A7S7NX65_PALFE|nr:SRPBCC family protein [Paludibaculum fermentans]QOY91442.1 SRPBCC family protein [Paludibaculum fermentans]
MWRSIALTTLFAVAATALISNFPAYALGLFVLLPVCIGVVAALLANSLDDQRRGKTVVLLALLAGALILVAIMLEGVICLLMAAPIAIPLALLGVAIGNSIRNPKHALAPALLLAPLFGGVETQLPNHPALRSVETVVDIQAPPETVWRHVIEFPHLPQPREWYFQAGIAYPLRARIEGRGPGAVRYCEFSTGPFVEPITTWDEPKLLAFRVTSNPEPMRELSPYDIHPAHLHGWFDSKRGQFRLEPLPNGGTRLHGTTWYTQRLQPEPYWSMWTDAIIHRIHQRVLDHIRDVSEGDRQGRSSIDLGQSDPSSRDNDRSASSRPPVWQRGQ